MQLPFLPPQGSVNAQTVDNIFLVLLLLSVFFTVLVAAIIVTAAIRYRRRSREELGRGGGGNPKLEWGGMAFLGVLSLGMFLWAGGAYINTFNPPPDAQPVYITGRMWMWKAQHQTGQREINALHLQVNKPYKLIMTSEDVIHDFYVPAFRIHTDVVPGRYTTQWFTPSQVGTYRLLCSQYCGTGHAFMEGEIIVMSEADFQAWSGGGGQATTAQAGAQLFQQSGCVGCHTGPAERAGAQPVGAVRDAGGAGERPGRGGQRGLPPGIDAEPVGQDRARLPADHAILPGTPDDRRGERARVVYPVARCGRQLGNHARPWARLFLREPTRLLQTILRREPGERARRPRQRGRLAAEPIELRWSRTGESG